VTPGDFSRAGASRSLITDLMSQVLEECSEAPRIIQARPEVSFEGPFSLELEVLLSGGEESRDEVGEGVRRDWRRRRLWRGRWMVIGEVVM
jgi:hypothetical protein